MSLSHKWVGGVIGSTAVSKTVSQGSIPCRLAIKTEVKMRVRYIVKKDEGNERIGYL